MSMNSAIADRFRTFRIAAWLGWQVESNWTSPAVFFIYAILRPVSTALILLVMYVVIAGSAHNQFFDYIYVSNALYIIVMQSIANMSWTVLEDREHYRMLKYIYTAPISLYWYLVGRATARVLIGIMMCILLIVLGVLWLGLQLNVAAISWGWLALYFVTGMPMLLAFGIIIGGLALLVPRNGEFIGEILANMLLLVCSVYFPPDILPSVLRKLSLMTPMTYWLEAMRCALEGGVLRIAPGGPPISPRLAEYSNSDLALIIVSCSVVASVAGLYFFRSVERFAKSRGAIDRLTGF